MNPVEQLIADLQAGTIADAEALSARIAALSNEELAEFEAADLDLITGIADGSVELEDGADRLEVLETLATAVEATRTEAETRINAATEEQARIDAVLERVVPVAETEPPAADDPDPDAPPADPAADPATDPPADDPTDVTDPAVDPALEPVPAAATPPAPVRPGITRVAMRVPQERTPVRAGAGGPVSVITAAAENPGIAAGGQIRDMEHLTEVLSRRAESMQRVRIPEGGAPMRLDIATITAGYSPEQDLRGFQHNAEAVDRAVTAALGRNGEQMRAMAAAGGFCAPAVPLYDQIAIAQADRPARSALPAFQATRGKVSYMPSPVWTDYSAGVSTWTEANDIDALDGTPTKPCVRVDCDDPVAAQVYAIPVCVTVGNFFDRTYPERREAIMSDVMAWQARYAERKLLDAMGTNSTHGSATQFLGTFRDVLAHLDLEVAAFQQRFRVDDAYTLEWWAPRWLKRNIRADIIRSMPSGGSVAERFAAAEGEITTQLEARGVNVTWLWEGENGAGQELTVQEDGGTVGWPTRVISYLFHPGAHRFLDGGEINIAIYRDSTLNSVNDLQIWGESFEGLMTPGLESRRLDWDICPNGQAAALEDTSTLCTSGS